MAGEWRQFNLGDLCGLITDGKHGDCEDHADSGFYFLSVKDVAGNRLVYENARQITEGDFAETHRRTNLEPGDVLFTNTGTIGRMALAQEDPRTYRTTFQKSVAILKPKRSLITPRFLYYLLQFDNAKLSDFAAGTTQKNLLLKDLRSFAVRVPSLPEQRAIAHILGALDDKIELNRRMNETLEAMARALFKSWFVDFAPVRAKQVGWVSRSGRNPPIAVNGGLRGDAANPPYDLPPQLLDLFPESFEDSELGEIPKGWAIGRFGDLVEQLRDQENPLASPDALFHHFSIPAFDTGQSSKPEYGESIMSLKSRVPVGVVLLSKLNPEIDRVWMVDVRLGERAVCSTEFLVLRALPPFTRSYIYCLARSPLFRQQIEGLVTGTSKSHQRAQVESILNLAVVIPPSPIVEAFDLCAEGLLARTLKSRRESHSLAALRDTLLPKLISGELRVRQSEETTGAAA